MELQRAIGRSLLLIALVACGCGGRIEPDDPQVDSVLDPPTDSTSHRIVQLTTDATSTCVVRGDGTVWCWGWNGGDRLGVGAACSDACTAPTQLPAFRDVAQLAQASSSQCAALHDGRVACRRRCRLIGHDAIGGCGSASADAAAIIDGLSGVAQVELGDAFDCVRFTNGSVACAAASATKAFDPALPAPATTLSVGLGHACAVVTGSELYCWGDNFDGQLGSFVRDYTQYAVRVEGLGAVDAVAAGTYLTCAHERDGHVSCFGIESWEAAGFSGSSECAGCDGFLCRRQPARIADVLAAAQLDIGGTMMTRGAMCGFNATNRLCALGTDGSPWCLGRSFDPDLPASPHKADVTDGRLVATSSSHACVVKKDGTVWCWGSNSEGELGDGTKTARVAPARVALPWTPEP